MSHPTGKLHRNSPERLWGKFSLYNILHSHTALNEQVTHWCSNLWLRRLVVRALDLQLTVMSSNPCNIAICRFFKMASAAILNLENFTFLTVGTVKSAELRHCAKFCRNRSNRGRDM